MPLATNDDNIDDCADRSGARGANATFNGNKYGAWRGRNSQYNTVYYNPQVLYRRGSGLNRNGVDFPNSPPTAAPLDPYERRRGRST